MLQRVQNTSTRIVCQVPQRQRHSAKSITRSPLQSRRTKQSYLATPAIDIVECPVVIYVRSTVNIVFIEKQLRAFVRRKPLFRYPSPIPAKISRRRSMNDVGVYRERTHSWLS